MVLLQLQHTSVITLQPRKLKLLEAMAGQGYALLGRSPSAGTQPIYIDGRFRSEASLDEAPTFQVAK